jgi:hypothetical protein
MALLHYILNSLLHTPATRTITMLMVLYVKVANRLEAVMAV